MKIYWKILLGLVALVFCILVAVIGYSKYYSLTSNARPYGEIRENIRRIELGMSKEEVSQIMGSPVAVKGDGCEVWRFDNDDPSISEPARCYFDAEGRVTLVICDDDYRLAPGQTHSHGDTLSDTAAVTDSLAD